MAARLGVTVFRRNSSAAIPGLSSRSPPHKQERLVRGSKAKEHGMAEAPWI